MAKKQSTKLPPMPHQTKVLKKMSNTMPSGTSIRFGGVVNSNPTYSKLDDIRKRIEERERKEREEREYKEYKERYSSSMINSIEEIDLLLDYFLNKCEIIIEKDYESYVIRKDCNDKNINTHIYIRVSIDMVTIQCEHNSFYEHIDIIDNTLYVKYNNLFEQKHFEYLNKKIKRIVDEIQDITKLNRKSKINKMIEDNDSEE